MLDRCTAAMLNNGNIIEWATRKREGSVLLDEVLEGRLDAKHLLPHKSCFLFVLYFLSFPVKLLVVSCTLNISRINTML